MLAGRLGNSPNDNCMDQGIRYFFYDLFFSMFVREPSDEIIDTWRKGLSILHESLPDDAIGKTSKELLDFLGEKDANETVRAEFIRLFWEPDGPVVSLLASHYVDGKPFGKYLVRMRTFLEKTPFRKSDDYTEPEDSLPFHLDLMRSFIGEEKKTSYPEKKAHWHNLQHELLNDYIHMWIDEFLSDLAQRDTEPFYREVALLMRLYFQEEREMILEE